jgi:hypothetical protein
MYACRCLSVSVCACLCLRQRDCRPSFFAAPSSYSPYSISILFPKRPNHAALPTIPLRHGLCLRAYLRIQRVADRCSDPEHPPFCACKSPHRGATKKAVPSLHAYSVRASAVSQTDNQNQIPPRQIPASRMSSSSNLTGSLLAVQAADCIDSIVTEVTCSSYETKVFFHVPALITTDDSRLFLIHPTRPPDQPYA